MPPAASEVWASDLGRLPRASTSTPASASSMAARRPDPPVPITRTVVEIWRSEVVLPEVVEYSCVNARQRHPITPMHIYRRDDARTLSI